MINKYKIKQVLESEACPEHGQHPSISILEDGKIQVTSCCEPFQRDLEDKMNEEIMRQTDEQIDGLINN